MDFEKLEEIINVVSKGDTKPVDILLSKPGARKHLESIVSIVIINLPYSQQEKFLLFEAFTTVLDNMEQRIKHQKQGQKILSKLYN